MEWEVAASEAVARYRTAQDAAQAEREWFVPRLWGRLRTHLRRPGGGAAVGASAAYEGRPPGYYVDYSDWPVNRSPHDSSTEEAIAALQGLSRYYGAAMESLKNEPEKHD